MLQDNLYRELVILNALSSARDIDWSEEAEQGQSASGTEQAADQGASAGNAGQVTFGSYQVSTSTPLDQVSSTENGRALNQVLPTGNAGQTSSASRNAGQGTFNAVRVFPTVLNSSTGNGRELGQVLPTGNAGQGSSTVNGRANVLRVYPTISFSPRQPRPAQDNQVSSTSNPGQGTSAENGRGIARQGQAATLETDHGRAVIIPEQMNSRGLTESQNQQITSYFPVQNSIKRKSTAESEVVGKLAAVQPLPGRNGNKLIAKIVNYSSHHAMYTVAVYGAKNNIEKKENEVKVGNTIVQEVLNYARFLPKSAYNYTLAAQANPDLQLPEGHNTPLQIAAQLAYDGFVDVSEYAEPKNSRKNVKQSNLCFNRFYILSDQLQIVFVIKTVLMDAK